MSIRKLKKVVSKAGALTFKEYILLTSRYSRSGNKFPHVKYATAVYERDRYRDKYD